nr:hypothetical protein [Tanacetum cinerariifolium]
MVLVFRLLHEYVDQFSGALQ